ncbi:hypothetical protein OROHE_000693 [Orobanche hederae]
MRNFNNKIRATIVLLLLVACCVEAEVHVQVINRLEDGLSMNVHCRSRDNDLGFHVLIVEEAIEWSFNLNFLKTTLFYCDVQWEASHRYRFDAYDAGKDRKRCRSKCRWMVAKDRSLYGYNQESGFWQQFPLIEVK